MADTIETSILCGISLKHRGISRSRPDLLFLHGLGDSGRAFDEAFESPGLGDYNLLIPDMPGYGGSAGFPDGSISFDGYVSLLCDLLSSQAAGPRLLVAHSMGGAIGSLLCSSEIAGTIRGFINVEGNLLTQDLFISGKAVAAADEGRFDEWFQIDFMEETVRKKWAPKDVTCQRYYESLKVCRPKAFLENSRELVRRSRPSEAYPDGELAWLYTEMDLPKLFCFGAGCPKETVGFLKEHHEEHQLFPGASHSLMIDTAADFYARVGGMAERLFG
ncbi:alpha/beta fold hydrolase [Candidatus Eisenbacteria bacterium]|uniref:Alpha/beta fold hydrolase n=1 Tax=Eiseniibacteriota bacterium TaxID=2212470 RepID=A0ABV6YIF7_UNCEI